MPAAALMAALICSPIEAAAQVSPDARSAVQDAFVAGDLERADQILQELLEQSPADPDLLRRQAAIQAARKDFESAQATIDQALALAPRDADIALARANILLWRGEWKQAREQADRVAAANPGYSGLGQLVEALDRVESERKLQMRSVGVGGSISDARFASGVARTWSVQRGSLAVGWGQGTIAALEVEREERAQTDTRIAARIDFVEADGRFFVAASGTPEPDFRETWSLGGGAEFDLDESNMIQLDGRFGAYRNQNVVAFGAGFRRRISRTIEATARSIHLFGGGEAYRLGGALRVDYRDPRLPELFATVATYPDAEVDGTRQLRAVGGGARFSLTEKLGIGITGEYESRDRSYRRTAFSLDLRWRFGGR